jgi:hypothetical protein
LKTAPDPTAEVPLHFGFSGDTDGLWRPYGVTANFAAQNLDFFTFLGDTMYEGPSEGSPAAADAFQDPHQALLDFRRKYREQLEPVNPGGFPGLQTFFASQANYTLLDNHELGNRQFTAGGAPAGVPYGIGVDASDPRYDVNTTGTFMNKTQGFQTLVQAYRDYEPIRERTISTPGDPRTDQTYQLYFAQQWGAHSIFFNLDDRSYRDIELHSPGGGSDTGPRADNPGRAMLGRTQLEWFKQSLLDAQAQNITWKFVAISSPIDQVGTTGGFMNGPDTIKSWIGGYRAERNELLKFIADNQIDHVVFLTTDDHEVRINEVDYLADPNDPQSVTRVPGAFQILSGPLGAIGPNFITDHSFSNLKSRADQIAATQMTQGIDPLGLDPSFLGLFNVFREGDPDADVLRQPVDFYSPDTFNYATLDVSADGQRLTVSIFGINSYAANTFPEPDQVGPERLILSFQISSMGGVPGPAPMPRPSPAAVDLWPAWGSPAQPWTGTSASATLASPAPEMSSMGRILTTPEQERSGLTASGWTTRTTAASPTPSTLDAARVDRLFTVLDPKQGGSDALHAGDGRLGEANRDGRLLLDDEVWLALFGKKVDWLDPWA